MKGDVDYIIFYHHVTLYMDQGIRSWYLLHLCSQKVQASTRICRLVRALAALIHEICSDLNLGELRHEISNNVVIATSNG